MSMNNAHPVASGNPRPRAGYLNLVLTANAVLLGFLLAGQARPQAATALGLQSTAVAGPPEETDLNARVSAAEQRKDMIAELRTMNQRIAGLEGKFKGALPVKVVEMPREGNAKPVPVPPK